MHDIEYTPRPPESARSLPVFVCVVTQKLISSGDAAGPWSKDDSGYSFILQGRDITSFSASDAKTRDLQRMAMRTRGGRYDTGLNTTMSPEVYKSLLRIFHVEGAAVLSTYDPCGVVQAAAVTLGRHCLTFLGRSTKTGLQSIDIDDVPLLGSKDVRARDLQLVVGDHRGNLLTESDAGTSDKGKRARARKTGGTIAEVKSKVSKTRDTAGNIAKGKEESEARGTGEATGKRKGLPPDEAVGTGEKRKGSGTRETAESTGKPNDSEARETRGSTEGGTGKRKGSGTREKAGTSPAESDGGAGQKSPLKRPGSSPSPSDDRAASSRKRPNIDATGSSSASVPMEEASSKTSVP